MSEFANCPSCGAMFEMHGYRCQYCGRAMQAAPSLEQKRIRLEELRVTAREGELSGAERIELGELYLALGQTALAEEQLRCSVEQDPDSPRQRVLLLMAMLGFNKPNLPAQTDPDEFERQVEWLRTNHPALPEARWLFYFHDINKLYESRNWGQGIEFGKAAVAEFPDNYLLRFYFALALIHFGNLEGLKKADYLASLRHMRIAAELNPSFDPAVKNAAAIEYYAAHATA